MAVDPHCFDADPELKILMRIRIQIQEGGGGRSAKNVHPPWQNPRYAPGKQRTFLLVSQLLKEKNAFFVIITTSMDVW